jgi:hypothetical protein
VGVTVLTELFARAISAPAETRERLLGELAARDPDAAFELRALIEAHFAAGGTFLAAPAAPPAAWVPIRDRLGALAAGTKLADFVLVRKLGAGAAGVVYLAAQFSLGRNVALKLTDVGGDEARVLASLEHPAIVKVHAVSRLDELESDVIVMQYVPGLSLARLIAGAEAAGEAPSTGASTLALLDGAVEPAQVYGLVSEAKRAALRAATADAFVRRAALSLATALGYAHQAGVLHLDVKPDNVLVDVNGDVFLTDFNVSMRSGEAASGVKGGTPHYMAPEQRRAFAAVRKGKAPEDVIGAAADVFGFGRLLEDLVRAFRVDCPDLARLVVDCTAEDARDRPADFAVVAERLRDAEALAQLRAALAAEVAGSEMAKLATRAPMLVVFTAILLPNLVSSALQVLYNQVHIIGRATPAQKALFLALVPPWNAFVFVVAGYTIYRYYRPYLRWRRAPDDPALRAAARRAVAGNHRLVALATAAGWGAGCALFTGSLHFVAGPLEPALWGHFLLSFTVGLLMPLAYGVLATRYLGAALFYPAALTAVDRPGACVRAEMPLSAQVDLGCRFLALAVPLAGAVLVVLAGPETFASGGAAFKALVVAMIGVGLAGFLAAEALAKRTQRWLERLGELARP